MLFFIHWAAHWPGVGRVEASTLRVAVVFERTVALCGCCVMLTRLPAWLAIVQTNGMGIGCRLAAAVVSPAARQANCT